MKSGLLREDKRTGHYRQAQHPGFGAGTRTVWIISSQEDGATWAPPVEITRSVQPADWTWYATRPGHGIQLKDGRVVIPCNHAVGIGTDETAVAEFAGGTLPINMRNHRGKGLRAVACSRDRAATRPVSRVIHAGPSAYSSLARLKDSTIGLRPECGAKGFRETITGTRFNTERLGGDALP